MDRVSHAPPADNRYRYPADGREHNQISTGPAVSWIHTWPVACPWPGHNGGRDEGLVCIRITYNIGWYSTYSYFMDRENQRARLHWSN